MQSTTLYSGIKRIDGARYFIQVVQLLRTKREKEVAEFFSMFRVDADISLIQRTTESIENKKIMDTIS